MKHSIMKQMKRWITALTALLLVAVMTAGALAEAQTAPAELFGKPWYNITVFGNLPDSAAEAADDLYSYYNYDFAAAHQDAAVNAARGDIADVQNAMKDALADASLAADPAVEQLRIFYEQAMDTETRKKGNGLEELIPYLAPLAQAETLKELEEAILAEDFPFNPFLTLYVTNDFATGKNCVNVGANLTFSDEPTNYDEPKDAQDMQQKISAMGDKYQSLLVAYMMTGQSQEEAVAAIQRLIGLERSWAMYAESVTRYMAAEYGAYAKDCKSMTLDEVAAYCSHFPMKETMKKFSKDQSERYTIVAPEWLTALDGAWSEENLSGLRELIMAKVMVECLPYLDRTEYNERLTAMGAPAETPEANAWDICSRTQTFGHLIGQLYAERTLGSTAKERLTSMSKGLLNELRGLISETTWISEDARTRALGKIETMKLNILEPEGGYRDYSSLSLLKGEEGGTLLGNYLRIKAWVNENDNALIGTPGLSRLTWDVMTPTTPNAGYDPTSNSINILPGYLTGGKYTDEKTDLELLGSIGTAIGHEICHGFDFLGSQFDAATAPNPLFSEADETAFLALVQKVVDYFNTLEVLPGVYEDGNKLKAEAAADLVGVQLTLAYAKTLGYQNLEPLFRSFAQTFAKTSDEATAMMIMTIDTHPAQYLRVNVNSQMMDEFYETYAVKEGDNMYVAPESRLRIWGADATV